jgi:hypothetical protein
MVDPFDSESYFHFPNLLRAFGMRCVCRSINRNPSRKRCFGEGCGSGATVSRENPEFDGNEAPELVIG